MNPDRKKNIKRIMAREQAKTLFKYLVIFLLIICLSQTGLFAQLNDNYENKYVQILLKNGRSLDGKVINQTEEKITLEIYGGNIPFYKKDIEQINIKEEDKTNTIPSGTINLQERKVPPQAKAASANEIKNIYLNVYKKLGNVEGYIVFYDNEGKQRATNGTLTLSVKRREIEERAYVGNFSMHSETIDVPVEKVIFFKNVPFNPNDFEYLELHSGDIIYALPINLPKAMEGDTVIVEWYRFNIEEVVR